MYQKQKTLKGEVVFEGIGVHSGMSSRLVLRPSAADSGIVISRTGSPHCRIEIGKVVPEEAMYATVIRQNGWKFSTIEHVMAAIGMLNIDNVTIELKGDEFPILDGSSLPFAEKIVKTGFCEQSAKKDFITPRKTITFSDEKSGRLIEITSAEEDTNLYVDYEAVFDNPVLGSSTMNCCLSEDLFLKEIAPARTFGFLEQLPFMHKHGLAKGASLENTIVIGQDGFINKLRFDDECVRHKVLDLLGDLSLLGKRLAGRVKAKKTGHSFNRLVIEHFVNNQDAWKTI
jgi:UDP-3-O-[3-hydroxymyristoyl] N-acetylglucosamine deacetylase